MLRKRRLGSGLLAVAMIASLVGAAGPATAEQVAGTPVDIGAKARVEAGNTSQPRTVTLVTGDRLTVSKDGKISVERGKGREGIVFLTHRSKGHTYVMPHDASALVRAGRVDARLFDVTALLEYGYDKRDNLPLIVTSGGGNAAARSTVTAKGATVVRDLPAVNGLAVRADGKALGELWRSLTGGAADARALGGGVSRMYLDALRKPTLAESVPQIGAPTAWAAGYDGKGVTVAVLDTGIDRAHPDLAGQIAGGQNFTEGEEDDLDRVGHGTHVASTIVGTGAASGGKYKGVAPGAKVLDGKVCVEFGCAESWILAGMQWAAEQGASVVNMSLGGFDTPEVDPLEEAVNKLTEQFDTLFVISAGNAGADESIGSPSSADAALSVGAVDKKDQLAGFSSRGPRTGDGAIKPDITAPGVDIVAANSKDGFLGEPGQPYTTLSGTSMAAPHVAGAAAILAQVRPDWAPDQLKATLMASAKPNPTLGAFAQGAGRVDVARAITQTVSTDPASASFGRQQWPHGDDKPVTRTITYRNTGSAALTLNLALQTVGPTGKPAPAKMFTLSASTLTVPAGGTGSVTVTADTRVSGPDGFYTGRLTATGGDTVVTTPFAIDREVESYNLTLKHTNREGKATGNIFTSLVRTDAFGFEDVMHTENGVATVRLPKGRYALLSFVVEDDEDKFVATLLAQPKVDVTANRTVAVDARKGRPVSVSVPRADATPLLSEIAADVITPDFNAEFSMLGETFEGLHSAQIGPAGTVKGFISKVAQTRAKVSPEGDPTNSPFTYHLAWYTEGKMVTGFTKNVKLADLATVKASYARENAADAAKTVFPVLPGKIEGGWGVGVPFQVPFERTEYYTGTGGVQWDSFLDEFIPADPFPEFVTTFVGPRKAYKAGKTYTEKWNRAVFGPTVAHPFFPDEFLSRWEDTLIVAPSLFGDAAGRAGYSSFDSAKTTVFRNGEKIAEVEDPFAIVEDVPKGSAKFRVEMQINRNETHKLSTEVRAAWTFTSGHVSGDLPKRLAASSVRFAPPLDATNAAPAGKTITFPVTVDRQPGSAAKPVKTLTVEVSFDDGKTWQKVKLTKQGSGWKAQIAHPDQAGFVSLRAASTDTAGNTVEQTVIRAYQIVK